MPLACRGRRAATYAALDFRACRGRRRRRLTQHSLPGCLLGITWVRLSPTDRASFAWRLRRVGPKPDIQHMRARPGMLAQKGGERAIADAGMVLSQSE